jgi:hypothetical protein
MTNRGEYMSKQFEQFCLDHGTQCQHITRNCPQQNGVSERTMRSLRQRSYHSPHSFWAECLGAFIYVLNRIPPLMPDCLMNSGLEPNQMSLALESGDALHMCTFRRTSVQFTWIPHGDRIRVFPGTRDTSNFV